MPERDWLASKPLLYRVYVHVSLSCTIARSVFIRHAHALPHPSFSAFSSSSSSFVRRLMRQGRSESSNGSDGQHGGVWYAKAVAGDAVTTQNGGGASSGSSHRHPWPMAAAGAAAWLQASPLGTTEDRPTTNCDATMGKKAALVSPATARAQSVFPVPGGP